MSRANPTWGAPRIHGELLKLGMNIGETSVSNYLDRHRKPPSQADLLGESRGIGGLVHCSDTPLPKRRKPFRCQAITVSGLTTMSAQRQSARTPHSQAQRSRSNGVTLRLLHRTMQNSELVPERKVFQLESGSGFKQR